MESTGAVLPYLYSQLSIISVKNDGNCKYIVL